MYPLVYPWIALGKLHTDVGSRLSQRVLHARIPAHNVAANLILRASSQTKTCSYSGLISLVRRRLPLIQAATGLDPREYVGPDLPGYW